MQSTWNFEARPFVAEEPRTLDTAEHVRQCLYCQKPPEKCFGTCFESDGVPQKSGRPRKQFDCALARRLHGQGYTDAGIAKLCAVRPERIMHWREEAGLKRNVSKFYCVERMRRSC